MAEDIRARVDTIHEMLGLSRGEAVMSSGHPLLQEYAELIPPDHPLCFFPKSGRNEMTIAKARPGSQTLQFLEALGNS